MKKIVFTSILTVILAIFSLLSLNLVFAQGYIWVEPGCDPPGCNVNPPIDVSFIDQEKDGGLRVKGGPVGVGIGFRVGNADQFQVAPDGTLTLQGASATFESGLISTITSGVAISGQTSGTTGSDIAVKGVAPSASAWAGWFQGFLGVDGSAIVGAQSNGYLLVGGSANQGYNSNGDAYFYGKIGIAGQVSIGTTLTTNRLEVNIGNNENYFAVANDTNIGLILRSGTALGTPYIDFYNHPSGGGSFDARIILEQTPSERLKITGKGVRIGNATDPAGGYPAGLLNASQLCLSGDCITQWSEVGGPGGSGVSYPTEIRETTGTHNADFSSLGTNGWNGIKNFVASDVNCGTEYHVCQGWEVVYLYMEGVSTTSCNTQAYDPDNSCLGWLVGPVSEVGTGDCNGYSSDIGSHSSIWYVNQWGWATCDSEMPVLCCK